MCRLLCVKAEDEFAISDHLKQFAEVARRSKEYQGHGWGCAYIKNGRWETYHNIIPIWEDDFSEFPRTTQLLAHARSAFQNKDIVVENNMPFCDGKYVFIFNGELHGVRINESGRIGAEKIFNFIKRFDSGDLRSALTRGIDQLKKRSRYIRAANIIIAGEGQCHWVSLFNEDHEYFTMHTKQENGLRIISSAPYFDDSNWAAINRGTIGEI
jgi:predicted glutamine amidotransferase